MGAKTKSGLKKDKQTKLIKLYELDQESINNCASELNLLPDEIIVALEKLGIVIYCELEGCNNFNSQPGCFVWDKENSIVKCAGHKQSEPKPIFSIVKSEPDPVTKEQPEVASFTEVKADPNKIVEVETFYKSLETKLSDLEIKDLGQKLAKQEHEKSLLELEKKMAADKFKQDIEGKEANIRDLYRVINRGTEFRDFLCYWKFNDPDTGKKSLYKFSSKEHIETTQMSDEERHDIFKNA